MKVRKVMTELARGVELARLGGVAAGVRFFQEEVLRNSWLRATGLLRWPPPAVECNLCGWRGRRFLTHCAVAYVDRNSFCPRCRSYSRHRGFAWLWRDRLAEALAYLKERAGLKVLFAPEAGMVALLEPSLGRLEGADIDSTNDLVKYREDVQGLTFKDESVSFASCFHVLEHVRDDRRALRELWRVLSPEGRLILCVPIAFGRRETRDFGGPNPLVNGHCFDYGEDFVERLLEASFSGRSFRTDRLVPVELHRRLALATDEFFLLWRTQPGKKPTIEREER